MITKSTEKMQIPITYDLLKEKYKEYRACKDKISRLVKDGTIIRLKKGLYLPVSDKSNEFQTLALTANLIYGPSYVSLETALSYYNIIPERVYSIGSVTAKRSKTFINQAGRFDYFSAKKEYFSIGIKQVGIDDVVFLIAAPEKAICDLIVKTSGLKIQSVKAMREYLEEDIRIDCDELLLPDISILDKVLETGIKKREIGFLKEYLIQNTNF